MSTVHDCKPGGHGARHGLPRLPAGRCLLACLLFGASAAHAGPSPTSDPARTPVQSVVPAETHVLTSHELLAKLQAYMQQRNVRAEELSADEMVRLMIDWFRLEPMEAGFGAASTDALVFRYGGWSEGCATAFKVSLLRRVADKTAGDSGSELLAGITLMFEPSSQAELLPYSTATTDWKSIDAFLQAVERSAAFKVLADAKPMSAMLETGGVR